MTDINNLKRKVKLFGDNAGKITIAISELKPFVDDEIVFDIVNIRKVGQ